MRLTPQQMTDALEKAQRERLEREARGAPKFPAELGDGPPRGDEEGTRRWEEAWERHCEEMRQWCEANGAVYPYE